MCHMIFCFLMMYILLPCLSPFLLYRRSNMRSFALFARLLYSNSSSPGRIGFLVKILPFDSFPHTHTGKSLGQVHGFSFFLNALFTILSSSEWKVIIHSLPPGFNRSIISSSESRRTSSSLFSSMRIAWNVLLEGCPDFYWYFIGMACLMISVSWPVVSMDLSLRAAAICLAMFLANLSSP